MGIVVDLSEKRREREAEKDRSKAYVPKETPVIDQDWDNELGRMVETIFVPGSFHQDRDLRDET